MSSTMRNSAVITRTLVAGMAILISMILPAQTFEKGFEQMFLPGHSHNLGSDYINKRVFEFFLEKHPPEMIKIANIWHK